MVMAPLEGLPLAADLVASVVLAEEPRAANLEEVVGQPQTVFNLEGQAPTRSLQLRPQPLHQWLLARAGQRPAVVTTAALEW